MTRGLNSNKIRSNKHMQNIDFMQIKYKKLNYSEKKMYSIIIDRQSINLYFPFWMFLNKVELERQY